MPAAVLERIFPNLRAGGYTITSPIDPEYNCAAFAAGESEEWWDPYSPDGVWPSAVDRDVFLQNFELVFELEGFEICADGSVEQGFEKIVLYADAVGEFCHAARQLPSGAWMSKLGELEESNTQRLTP